MADETSVRQALMQAVGSASVALHALDNGGPDLARVIAEARAALVDGFNGQPTIRPQSCPRGVHRDWWTDGEGLPCPWCRIAVLEGAPAHTDAGAA